MMGFSTNPLSSTCSNSRRRATATCKLLHCRPS